VSGARTRTVFRWMAAWNDEKEERWLAEQERAGWRLKTVHPIGYVLEEAPPANAAYRLDFGPPRRADREEYLGLYRDAGWELAGTRGPWHFFRKAVADGAPPPEIFTDVESRVAKYRRAIALWAVLCGVIVSQMATNLSRYGASSPIFYVHLAVVAALAFCLFRLAHVIGTLRRRGRA
jgi:uncharacterized protein DUF2812